MDIQILSANKTNDKTEYSTIFDGESVQFDVIKNSVEKSLKKITSAEDKPEYIIITNALKKSSQKEFQKKFTKLIHNYEDTIQEKPWKHHDKKKAKSKDLAEKTVEYVKLKTHIYPIEFDDVKCFAFVYNGTKIIATPVGFDTALLPELVAKTKEVFANGEEQYPQGYEHIQKSYVYLTFWQKHLPQKFDPFKEKLRKCVMIIAIVVFLVALGLLVRNIIVLPLRNASLQNEIQSVFYEQETDPTTGEVVTTKNWDKLKKINKEIVGWINIDHTNIDYPLLYSKKDTSSSQFYLYKDYKKDYSDFGSIFLDYRSTSGMDSKNVIVHGHNIGDGSMFSDLSEYAPYYTGNLDFYKKSPTIEISTPDGETSTYKIFSVFKTNVLHTQGEYFDFYCNEFESNSQFLNYIYNLQIRSLITTPVKVNEDDQLLTLVTCSYTMHNFRIVVVARKVREGESEKVNVSKASIPKTSLWPQYYYDKFNRTRPTVSTFKTEYEKGNIKWYDGNYKEDGSEDLPSSYDVEIPTTAPATTRKYVVQVYNRDKIILQKQIKSGSGITLPSIDKTYTEGKYKYTFERWSYKGSSSASKITTDTVITAVYKKTKIQEKATEATKKKKKNNNKKSTTATTEPTTESPSAEATTEPSEVVMEQEE